MGIVDAGGDRTLVDMVPDASRAENFPGDPRGGGELLISSDFRIAESYHRVVVLVRFLFEARVVVTGPPQVLIFLPEAEFIAHILLKYLRLGCPNECTIGGPRIIGHGTVDCMIPVMCGIPRLRDVGRGLRHVDREHKGRLIPLTVVLHFPFPRRSCRLLVIRHY